MANAWLRMTHENHDELRRILDIVGQTIKVHARQGDLGACVTGIAFARTMNGRTTVENHSQPTPSSRMLVAC